MADDTQLANDGYLLAEQGSAMENCGLFFGASWRECIWNNDA